MNIFFQNRANGITRFGISKNTIETALIPLLPLPEQHYIAEILSTVDETIEQTEALIEKYRNIKKGLMADLLTRGIDEMGRIRSEDTHRFRDSPLGRIPEEWEVVNISDYAENITSGGTPSREIKKYFDGIIRWLKTAELRDKEIYESEEKITELGLQESSAKIFPINTVLIAMYGATIGKLGILKKECATNQACCAFICHKNSYKYLFYYLLNSREKLISLGAGAGQPNISQSVLKSFPIFLPPLPEQNRIAEILTASDERIEKEETYRDKLLQLKKGLMQDLLTGRVRVNKYNGGKYNV